MFHATKTCVLISLASLVSASAFAGEAHVSQGKASYYSSGSRTASGEHFNPNGLTAAHRSLPFGTRLRVTNVSNGRTVVVRVNDRGPFVRGRMLDLSRGAAKAIGMVNAGTASIRMARVN